MICNEEVTVIVPIYNVAEYLEKCLSSISGQTYKNLQIILVDDGSTDDSGRICDRYQEQDARIIVIHKTNEGLVKARKTGIFNATGKYICYVDGDDWIESDMIECFIKDLERTEADLIVSGHYCDSKDGSQKISNSLEPGLYHVNDVISMMLYTGKFYEFGISQFVWAKLFRKDILRNVQLQVDDRISCGEDVAVTYAYILQSHKIYQSNYTGYHYRQRTNSMTNCFDENEFIRLKLLLEHMMDTFYRSEYDDKLYRQLNQYAKNLLLVRQIGFFDTKEEGIVLKPFGGVPADARLVIYGAGKLGQSIRHYLNGLLSIEIVDWLDKNDSFYAKNNYKINSIEKLKVLNVDSYDFIIVAVSNPGIADDICKNLIDMGIMEEKIKCLHQDFIDERNYILDQFQICQNTTLHTERQGK